MATHGEKRWPPAGRFDGRLRGAFHGHRHMGRVAVIGVHARLSPPRDCERHVHYEVESDQDDRIVRVARRAAAYESPATRSTALPQRTTTTDRGERDRLLHRPGRSPVGERSVSAPSRRVKGSTSEEMQIRDARMTASRTPRSAAGGHQPPRLPPAQDCQHPSTSSRGELLRALLREPNAALVS